MKQVRRFFALYWQALVSGAVILVVVMGLLGFRLGSVTPGMSSAELEFINTTLSLEQLIANPLYLPMKLPMWLLHETGQASIFTLRAVGALFGVVTVIMFYFLLRRWHTRRVALLTAFLLIVSSWFLQVSRLALPYILFAFAMTALIAAAAVLADKRSTRLQILAVVVAVAVSLYIPGIAWLVAIMALWQVPVIKRLLGSMSLLQIVLSIVLFGTIVAPLFYAFYVTPDLLKVWLAVPGEIIPLEWLRRILVLPVFLTAQGPMEPVYNLGRLPLLDVFTTVIVILGAYSYYFKAKLRRTQLLVVLGGLAAVLIALNGPTFLPLLLPIVFIVATAGLTLLLQQWFTVFPRNPLARGIGVLTIAIVVSITGMYHARRYFVAWAGNPETRTTFIYQLDTAADPSDDTR